MPLPKKALAFTVINLVDAIPVAVTCLYFWFISKDWYTLNFYQLLLCYAAFLGVFICPESPRWLLVNGKSAEAIKVLNWMAKINGNPQSIPEDAQFVEDPTAFAEAEPSAEGEKNKQLLQVPNMANNSQMQLSKDNSVLDWDNLVPVDPSNGSRIVQE